MFQFFGLKKKNLCKYKMGIEKYSYNIKELIDKSSVFKEKFDQLYVFGNMEYEQRKGCKIGHSGGVIHIYPASYYQSVSRWWYSESRNELLKYFEKEIPNYVKYLNDISNIKKQNPYQQNLSELCENNCKFIKCISPGLEKCKYIYSDFPELERKINEYIKFLDEFINIYSDRKIETVLSPKEQQQQQQSMLSLSNYPNMTATKFFQSKTDESSSQRSTV